MISNNTKGEFKKVSNRTNYSNSQNYIQRVTLRGIWREMSKHSETGVDEQHNKISKEALLRTDGLFVGDLEGGF